MSFEWRKHNKRLEELSPYYKLEMPTKEGFYYVAVQDTDSSLYHETIMYYSGQWGFINDEDNKHSWLGEFWENDYCLSYETVQKLIVNNQRKYLIGLIVSPIKG